MSLLDKFKNMFTEEIDEDDVKVEKIKKEVTHVAIESPIVSSENKITDDDIIDSPIFKTEEKTRKPVFFNDNDFEDIETHSFRREKKEEKKTLYMEKEETRETKVFKPTPIISPVYGILDKNYHKEDIVDKKITPRKTNSSDGLLTVDSIRNKAYGTLEDELENTLFGQNSILFKDEEENTAENNNEDYFEELDKEKDLLDDLTTEDVFEDNRKTSIEEMEDLNKELDDLLNKSRNYQTDENENLTESDLFDIIDSTIKEREDV